MMSCLAILSLVSPCLDAQGPRPSYYYSPDVDLSWAECYLYQEGGSKRKIPFLPVINRTFYRAPLGTDNYSRDIDVRGQVVFIGNGLFREGIWDCFKGMWSEDLDVQGKIVMFCFDYPDRIEDQVGKDIPLEKRIAECVSRGASGIVLFSSKQDYPFLYVRYEVEQDIPDISAVTITMDSAKAILESGGFDTGSFFSEWKETGLPKSSVLYTHIGLRMAGAFGRIETENFDFRFREENIARKNMDQIAGINERALEFLFECFEADKGLTWQKKLIVYFRSFDSKVFYTHHWGFGLAGPLGIFNVHQGGEPDFGLAVHENMHILSRLNWSPGTSSFMNEGIAQYAQAQATDPDMNHDQVSDFLNKGIAVPLEELVRHQIGMPGIKTRFGYPAAGSFVAFLIDIAGLESFKKAYELENRSEDEKKNRSTWTEVYGKPLGELERAWLAWIKN